MNNFNNIYMSVSTGDLQKMQLALRETLTMMTRVYGNMVFSSNNEIGTFHHAVETVRNQYDQIREAMEEIGIRPLSSQQIKDEATLMPSSELHF